MAISRGGVLAPGLEESIRSRRIWGWRSASQVWAPGEASESRRLPSPRPGSLPDEGAGKCSHTLTLVPSVVRAPLPARSSVLARPVVPSRAAAAATHPATDVRGRGHVSPSPSGARKYALSIYLRDLFSFFSFLLPSCLPPFLSLSVVRLGLGDRRGLQGGQEW